MHSGRCCRPACGAPSVAVLSYDHARALAWIDDPGNFEGGWPLCADHADRLTVPANWELRDRRNPRHSAAPTNEIRIAS